MAKKVTERMVERWVRKALRAMDVSALLEVRDVAGGARLLLRSGQEFEVQVREAPEHPEGRWATPTADCHGACGALCRTTWRSTA